MNLFTNLRLLVMMRRLVRAAESIAASQSILARSANAEWNKRHRSRTNTPALELAEMDLPSIEKDWRERREAAFIDLPPEPER